MKIEETFQKPFLGWGFVILVLSVCFVGADEQRKFTKFKVKIRIVEEFFSVQ